MNTVHAEPDFGELPGNWAARGSSAYSGRTGACVPTCSRRWVLLLESSQLLPRASFDQAAFSVRHLTASGRSLSFHVPVAGSGNAAERTRDHYARKWELKAPCHSPKLEHSTRSPKHVLSKGRKSASGCTIRSYQLNLCSLQRTVATGQR